MRLRTLARFRAMTRKHTEPRVLTRGSVILAVWMTHALRERYQSVPPRANSSKRYSQLVPLSVLHPPPPFLPLPLTGTLPVSLIQTVTEDVDESPRKSVTVSSNVRVSSTAGAVNVG